MPTKKPWTCSHTLQGLAFAVAALLAFTKTLPSGVPADSASELSESAGTSQAKGAGPPWRQTQAYERKRPSSPGEEALDFEAEGRVAEAQRAWQTLLAANPAHGLAHARLAALAHLAGDRVDCEKHRLEALRLGAALPSVLEPSCAPPGRRLAEAGGALLPIVLPPVRVDVGSGSAHAAETILTAGNGTELVAAWTDLRTGGNNGPWKVGAAISRNGGATWSDGVVAGPTAASGDYEGDPMVAYDPRTGNSWVGGITFEFPTKATPEIWVARRPPGAMSFNAPVTVRSGGFIDKGLMTAGPRPGLPSSTRLYLTYSQGIQFSDDLGATWSAPQAFPPTLGYQPRIGANGVLYVLYWEVPLTYKLVKSTDGGVTFGPPVTVATRLDVWGPEENNPRVPGEFRVAPLAYLAISPTTGVLHVIYPDSTSSNGTEWDLNLYYTRSTNGGATWSTPVVINGDSTPPRDQFQAWIETDPSGRLHVVSFDTRATAQQDADGAAVIGITYTTSQDGGNTWSELEVGPNTLDSSLAAFSLFQQFVGDYIALAPAGDRVHLIYPTTADGHLHIAHQILDYQGIFADGFESGGTDAWGVVVP